MAAQTAKSGISGKNVVQLYDEIAEKYGNDKFDLYRQCHEPAVAQIIHHQANINHALDCAAGVGLFWERARCSGFSGALSLNDISSQMLEGAKTRFADQAQYYNLALPEFADGIPTHAFDLVCSHFIFAYVSRQDVYAIAKRHLKPGGYISVVTSTQQCLAELYESPIGWVGKLIGAPKAVEASQTPQTHEALQEDLKNQGFEIIEDEHLRPEIVFKSHQDISEMAFDAGWALDFFVGPTALIKTGASALLRIANARGRLYPLRAHMDFSIVLARWPGS